MVRLQVMVETEKAMARSPAPRRVVSVCYFPCLQYLHIVLTHRILSIWLRISTITAHAYQMRQCRPLRIWRHLQRPSILYTPCISARSATRFGVIVVSLSKSADTTVQTVYLKSPRQAFVQIETGMCQRFCEAV